MREDLVCLVNRSIKRIIIFSSDLKCLILLYFIHFILVIHPYIHKVLKIIFFTRYRYLVHGIVCSVMFEKQVSPVMSFKVQCFRTNLRGTSMLFHMLLSVYSQLSSHYINTNNTLVNSFLI